MQSWDPRSMITKGQFRKVRPSIFMCKRMYWSTRTRIWSENPFTIIRYGNLRIGMRNDCEIEKAQRELRIRNPWAPVSTRVLSLIPYPFILSTRGIRKCGPPSSLDRSIEDKSYLLLPRAEVFPRRGLFPGRGLPQSRRSHLTNPSRLRVHVLAGLDSL